VADLLIANAGMRDFQSWHLKTIATCGKTPITVNGVFKACVLVGCQPVQDAISAVSLPCRCLVDGCNTWATLFQYPSHLKGISLRHC